MQTREQVAQFLRDQAVESLLRLTPDNYCKGPDPDDFEPQRDVWFFGCDVEDTEAYIKLTLQPDRRRRTVTHAIIWAFHKAAYPMKYPLRELP